jgi:hypothetical protein
MKGITFTIDALFSAFLTFMTIALVTTTFQPIERPSTQMTEICWDVNTVLDLEGTISSDKDDLRSALSILLPPSLSGEMTRTKYSWNGTDWVEVSEEILYYPEGISGERQEASVSMRTYMKDDFLYIARLRCYRR